MTLTLALWALTTALGSEAMRETGYEVVTRLIWTFAI